LVTDEATWDSYFPDQLYVLGDPNMPRAPTNQCPGNSLYEAELNRAYAAMKEYTLLTEKSNWINLFDYKKFNASLCPQTTAAALANYTSLQSQVVSAANENKSKLTTCY
jgi:hypothetical protein